MTTRYGIHSRPVFYGWWLVAITAITLAIIITPIFHGLGTFFVALEGQFHWSRTLLAGAFTLARVEGALMGPMEGFLTDRLGPRRMVFIGFSIAGVGFLLFSFIQNIVGFYLAFLVIVSGAGMGGFVPLMAAINNWFVRRRATAMAIASMGLNLGGLLVPALAWGVTSFGWRTTAMGVGVFTWLMAFPIALAIRNRPEDYGQRPDGLSSVAPPPTAIPQEAPQDQNPYSADFTVRQALRTRAFWCITAAHGFSAMVAVTLAVHAIPMLTDTGLSLEMAGTVVATYAAIGLAAQLVGGYVGDRVPKRLVIFAFTSIQACGLMIAALTQNTYMAFLFAVFYGIGFGGRVPLLTAIRGDYFGRAAFATILGMSMLPMNVLNVGAPLFAGFMYDTQGSYLVPFTTLAILNFLGGASILIATRPTLSFSPRPS